MTGERIIPGLYDEGFKGFATPRTAQNKQWMDENFRLLSMLCGGWVKSRLSPIPSTGDIGDVYIVPSNDPTNPNNLAIWDGTPGAEGWIFYPPSGGWRFMTLDTYEEIFFAAGSWVVSRIIDAPSDGSQYVRKNRRWEILSSGGGGWQFSQNITTTGVSSITIDVSEKFGAMLLIKTMTIESSSFPRLMLSPDGGATKRNQSGDYSLICSKSTDEERAVIPVQSQGVDGTSFQAKILLEGLNQALSTNYYSYGATVGSQATRYLGWSKLEEAHNALVLEVDGAINISSLDMDVYTQ